MGIFEDRSEFTGHPCGIELKELVDVVCVSVQQSQLFLNFLTRQD